MAGYNGRSMPIDWDAVALAGVQTRGLSASNDFVDITSDDDSGWRTLLADPGMRSIEVTVSGVTKNETLLAEMFNASITGETLDVNLPSALSSPGSVSGTFMLSSYEQDADHDSEVRFSATFMSSGTITYTASSGS